MDLIDVLLEKNYSVCLETNGSIDIRNLTQKKSLMISLDVKCPSSKMESKMSFENILLLDFNDQLKFVIKNKIF